MSHTELTTSTRQFGLIALSLITVVSCDEATAPLRAGAAAQLLVISGDHQQDTVGKELNQALVVRVLDSAGTRVPNQIVNFRVTVGGGSVFGGAAITNDSGEARERWTLGTNAGELQRLEARAVDTRTGAALVFGTFEATGVPDAAAAIQVVPARNVDTLVFLAGDTTLTGDTLRFTALVRDQFSNLKTGATVNWTSTVTPVATVTTGFVTVVGAGNTTIKASTEGIEGTHVLVGQLRVPVTLTVIAGGNQSDTVDAVLAGQMQVRAADRRGNPFAGSPVVFTGLNGSPVDTIAGCGCNTDTTDANGIASVAWRLGISTGAASMRADGRLPSSSTIFQSVTSQATVRNGNAVSLLAGSGGGTNTGLVVAVRDRRGNAVQGVAVRWALTGSGTLADSLSVSDASGFTGTTAIPQSGATVTVTATVTGLTGSPVSFTVSARPKFALDFVQSFVSVPDDTALDLTTKWTIEAWLNPRSANSGNHQDIVSKWDGVTDASYILQLNESARIRLVTNNGVTQSIVLSKAIVANNQWHHVAVTFDGDNSTGTLSVYVNGVLDTTVANVLTPINSTQPLAFGREGNFAGGTFNGLIDEVRLWKLVRSGADIATFRNQSLLGTELGLVGYWRFDEGTGDVVFDSSGRGNKGRLGISVGPDLWDPTWTSAIVAPIP